MPLRVSSVSRTSVAIPCFFRAQGDYLTRITRHMLGLYHGCHGGRHWRRMLSEDARQEGSGAALVRQALALISDAQASRAAAQ